MLIKEYLGYDIKIVKEKEVKEMACGGGKKKPMPKKGGKKGGK